MPFRHSHTLNGKSGLAWSLHIHLATCYSDLATCYSDLATSYSDLATSNSDLATSYSDLATCFSDLATSYSDLATSYSDLATSCSDLATFCSDLATLLHVQVRTLCVEPSMWSCLLTGFFPSVHHLCLDWGLYIRTYTASAYINNPTF